MPIHNLDSPASFSAFPGTGGQAHTTCSACYFTTKMMWLVPLLIFVRVTQHAVAVEVYVGAESIVLPCPVSSSILKGLAVVWRREDLSPPTVHYKEQGNDRLDKQNQRYRDRTSVSDPLQENRVADLTLIKPLINDNGTYTCIIRRGGEELNRTEVLLLVKEPFPHMVFLLGISLGAIGSILICAFVAWCWRRKRMIRAVCKVMVREGTAFIKLSFQTTVKLLEGDTVEWILSGSSSKVVRRHVVESNQPENQHESNHGHTEMTNLLQTGDLSLTLSDPRCGDSGVYICTVCRDGNILAQEVVEVQVQVCQVKVNEGVRFIKLLCQTAVELLEGDTVEWILSGPQPKVVHRSVIGRNQPENQHESYHGRTEMTDPLWTGDLSLTLSDPRCGDSGIYICTARRDRDRDILVQNVVEVQVQAAD